MPELRVIGVPRSGTNLVKYLVTTYSNVNCFFNLGWWKHAIIPPLMDQEKILNDNTPTIVMFRHPIRQIISFYNFSRKGRSAISGANDFHNFISSPIIMKTSRDSTEYYFSNPIEYWTQFYHSAAHWKHGRKFFVDLRELQDNPDIITAVLSEIFPETQFAINPALPGKYLGRNPDGRVSQEWAFETDTTIEKETQDADALLKSLSPDEVASILTNHANSLYDHLRAERSPKAIVARTAT